MESKRIVIKIGTKCLTSKDRALDKDRVKDIVDQISTLRSYGFKPIVITSGAIGAGMWLMGLKKRPTKLSDLQAAAAIGQSHLMHLYSDLFKARGYVVGQILLTQEDFNDRKRYLNIKHTLDALIDRSAIPIINENDTVATDEIRCGDNDRLSGLVADLARADMLIILTDVDGLLDRNGNVVGVIDKITPEIMRLGGASHCDLGTGGMATKLEAARTANRAGIVCFIVNGHKKDAMIKAAEGEPVGTMFRSDNVRFIAKKRWIAFSSKPKGFIIVDDGAREALRRKDSSLLASGIINIEGHFAAGDVVVIAAKDGCEIAKGVSNYSSSDVGKIKGKKSSGFKSILGRMGPDEVVHKNNLVIL